MPLGGNTVFFRREFLEALHRRHGRYWDEDCLTEDCKIGILASVLGFKVDVVYIEELVTREETPATLAGFIRQRVRWMQGFIHVFCRGRLAAAAHPQPAGAGRLCARLPVLPGRLRAAGAGRAGPGPAPQGARPAHAAGDGPARPQRAHRPARRRPAGPVRADLRRAGAAARLCRPGARRLSVPGGAVGGRGLGDGAVRARPQQLGQDPPPRRPPRHARQPGRGSRRWPRSPHDLGRASRPHRHPRRAVAAPPGCASWPGSGAGGTRPAPAC